ncbi:hypothetical protein LXL04_017876 [Taraxacum kok-saghyz]
MTSQKNQLRATDDVSRPARTKFRAIRFKTSFGKIFPSTSRFLINRDRRSSDGFNFRAVKASVMLFLSLISAPIPKSFFSRHRNPGYSNRCNVASVAESNAVANGFSDNSNDNVSGSLPNVNPQMLSNVNRRRRSCKSTGKCSSEAFSKMSHSLVLIVRLTHLAIACRSVRVVNSKAAVFRCISHVSPSLLNIP